MEKIENFDPKPYLERFGYLWYARGEAEAGASVDIILKLAIQKYQEIRVHLKVTGEIDEETIKSMECGRCGNLDFGHGCGEKANILLYYSKPEGFDPKKFLEAYRFLYLARAHLSMHDDGNGVSEEDAFELAVKKFQQTYGYNDTGKLDEETMACMKKMARGGYWKIR